MTDAQLDALKAENEACDADHLDAARRCHEVFPTDPVRWCYACRQIALVLALREARAERDSYYRKLVEYGTTMQWVSDALDGKPVSEFAESFGAVMSALDLRQRAEQAEAEVARLRDALAEWAAHKPFCGIMGQDNRFAWRDGDKESCTCGLAALKATGGQP